MSYAQPNRRNPIAETRHRYLGLSVCLLAGTIGSVPVAAQVTEGPSENVPGTEGGPGAAAGAVAPAFPGAAPETLPPPPGGGFGLPNPVAPPYSVNPEIPTLTSPPTLRLLPPRAGVVPLQEYDPTVPAILIQPRAFLGELFTDNVNFVHSPRKFAAETFLGVGVSASADTPRFQGVLTAQGNGTVYLPGNNSSLNQIYGTLYGTGFGTIVPDALFVDVSSALTQSTTAPGFGFQNLSTLPRNQQTQQFTNYISPYLVKSFDGVIDSQLRYTFSSSNYGGNTVVATAPLGAGPNLTNLTTSTLNEGTFIAATGQDFQTILARFTADASEYSSAPTSQNTQVSAFNDVEYHFTPTIAALARAGYQNLRFPGSPAASFAGATWLIGGRVGTIGPDQPAYVALQYGRQQGVYGFTGSAQANITPTMIATANLIQGVSSQGQFFQNSLGSSTLNSSGAIVNQTTGLPTSFFNPGVGLTNNVYRQHQFNVGVTDAIPPNSYSLYGFYSEFQTLTPPITAPTKTLGVNFTYTRDIRPDLSGSASLGYVNSANSPTTATAVSSTTNINTVNATVGLNYVFARNLTGSIVYNFLYQTGGNGITVGRTAGDIFVNQLQLVLSKTF